MVFVAAWTAAAAAAAAAAACVNDDGNAVFVASFVRRCSFCSKSAESPVACAFSISSWMGNGCGRRNDETDDADDEVDDDDDDDVVDEFAVLVLFGWCSAAATAAAAAAAVDGSKLIWSISNLIGAPPADSFSQILAGDQMIAFELDRVDLVDKFNGSSSSISAKDFVFQGIHRLKTICIIILCM